MRTTILDAIAAGEVDDSIWEINQALIDRRKAIGRDKFRQVKVGDKVRFTDDVGDKWAGVTGTIINKGRTNVTVKLEDGSSVIGNPAELEIVS